MRIFVATKTFLSVLGGKQLWIYEGDTVREGHPLVKGHPTLFAPQKVKYEHLPPKGPAPRKPGGK